MPVPRHTFIITSAFPATWAVSSCFTLDTVLSMSLNQNTLARVETSSLLKDLLISKSLLNTALPRNRNGQFHSMEKQAKPRANLPTIYHKISQDLSILHEGITELAHFKHKGTSTSSRNNYIFVYRNTVFDVDWVCKSFLASDLQDKVKSFQKFVLDGYSSPSLETYPLMIWGRLQGLLMKMPPLDSSIQGNSRQGFDLVWNLMYMHCQEVIWKSGRGRKIAFYKYGVLSNKTSPNVVEFSVVCSSILAVTVCNRPRCTPST